MRRTGTALLAAILLAATLAGCGLRRGGDDRDDEQLVDVAAGLSPDAAALTAIGYDADQLAPAGTAPRPATRVWLRRNLLHGEVVVQTGGGSRTVLVQRGQVSDLTETALTVASSDGFTQTWTFGDELRVIEARGTIDPQQLQPGDRVGVAGTETAGEPAVRIIVIDNR